MSLTLTVKQKKALVDFHFKSLQGMYFSEYISKQDHVLLFSDFVKDSYYNYIAQVTGDINEIIRESTCYFSSRNRTLAIYVTPCSTLYNNEKVIPKDFRILGCDSYMAISDFAIFEKYQIPKEIIIENVDSNNRDQYVKSFHIAYSGDNPNDPYANLPEYYSQSLKQSFEFSPEGFNKVYVCAKIGTEIVGVGSMLYNHEIAGIYGVGTVGQHRNKGVASSLMKYLISKATYENITTIMLQTEYGSKVESWYQKMGFSTVFLGKYFVKS